MSKRLILVLALVFAFGITAVAFAEVQNVKVSGDILMQGLNRTNIILRGDNAPSYGTGSGTTSYRQYSNKINAFLSHIRLRVDADLTDNVSATVRLINERMWGEEYDTYTDGNTVSTVGKGHSTDIQLDLAYVTAKEFLYSPLTLTVGRQELHFGNDLIIGDVDTNNLMSGHGVVSTATGQYLPRSLDDLTLRKSFDAIRATLNYDPLVVDAVFARIDKTVDDNNAVDLWGANANYALNNDTTLEAYYWLKRRQKAGAGTSISITAPNRYIQGSHHDTTNTIGARAAYSGVKNTNLGLEAAYQFGKKVNNTTIYPDDVLNDGGYRERNAYAIQLTSMYNLADIVKKYDPAVGFNYTLLSGDPYKSRNKHYTGWDPMFENQAQGTLFNKIMGYSNAQLFNVTAAAKPWEDVKLAFDWYYIRLMKAYRLAGNDGDASSVVLTGVFGDPTYSMRAGKKALGNEFDANITYDYTEDVQFGLNLGWFVPGDAFDDSHGNKKTASQVIGSMKVTF